MRNICCEKCPWYSYDDGDIYCLLVSDSNKVYSEDEDRDEVGCNFHIKRLHFMSRRFKERLETWSKEQKISEEEFERHVYNLKQKRKSGYIVIHDGLDTGLESDTYKPLMKGGHTHNHIFNAVNRHTFRKKKERKKAKDHKYIFYRQQKETLEEAFNLWAMFKKIFKV